MSERAAIDPLAQAVLATSAEVAGLCDKIDHLELAEVEGVLARATALVEAVAARCPDVAPVEDVVAAAADKAHRRTVKYGPAHGAGVPADPPLATWEALRGYVESCDRLSDPDFMGRARPAQLRHLSYSFPKLAGSLVGRADDVTAGDLVKCLQLGVRVVSACRARFEDDPVTSPPRLRR